MVHTDSSNCNCDDERLSKVSIESSSLSCTQFLERAKVLLSTTRKVHFSDRSNVTIEIPTVDQYSQKEFHASFYSHRDYQRMKADRNNSMKKMKGGIVSPDEDLDCCLESEADAKLRRKLSKESIVTVLVEQEMQWSEISVQFDELLSDIYSDFSFASLFEAQQRALELENNIQDYVCPGRWSSAVRKSKKISHLKKGSFVAPDKPEREESLSSISSISSTGSSASMLPMIPMRPPPSPLVAAWRVVSGSWRSKVNELILY